MLSIPIILELPRLHSSLGVPPHLQTFHKNVTLLEWMLETLRRWQGVSRVVLANADAEQSAALAHIAARYDHIEPRTDTRIGAYHACLANAPEGRIAIVALESVWCPEDILVRLHQLMTDTRSACACVDDLPANVAPLLIGAGMLPLLAQIKAAAWSPELDTQPLRVGLELLRKSGADIPLAALSMSASYGLERESLPSDMSLATRDGVRVAQRMARQAEAGDTIGSSLVRWTQCWSHRRAARRRWSRTFARVPSSRARPLSRRSARRRVLYASNPSAVSGPEQNLRELVRHLDRDRIEPIALVALEGTLANWLREENVSVVCPNRSFGDQSIDNCLFVAGVLRRLQPDLIHANAFSGWPLLASAALEDVPYVQHVRVMPYPAVLSACDAAHTVISETAFLRQQYVRAGCRADRIVVVPSGVDCERFRPGAVRSSLRTRLGLSDRTFLVVMIARYVRWKRHDLVVEAVASLRQDDDGPVLLLIGDDQEDAAYSARIRSLAVAKGMAARTRYLPFVEDVRDVLAVADAFVLPSEGEPSGRSTVEAMAMGVPVIVCRLGGHVEAVDNGGGYLVEPGDVAGIARHLELLRSDPALRRRVGEEGVRQVSARFSADRVNATLLGVYDTVVDAHRRLGTRAAMPAVEAARDSR